MSIFPSWAASQMAGGSQFGGGPSGAQNSSVNILGANSGDEFLGMLLQNALGGPPENGGPDISWVDGNVHPVESGFEVKASNNGTLILALVAGLALFVVFRKA